MTAALPLQRGAALPITLVLALGLAFLMLEGLGGAATQTRLAALLQSRQQARLAAEAGLQTALQWLQVQPQPPAAPIQRSQGTPLGAGSHADLTIAHRGPVVLPSGFSLDLLRADHYELASVGHGPQQARLGVIQGMERLWAPTAAPPAESGATP